MRPSEYLPIVLTLASVSSASPLADPSALDTKPDNLPGRLIPLTKTNGKYDQVELTSWVQHIHEVEGFLACNSWYRTCQRWAGHGKAETQAGVQVCIAWAKACGWRDGQPPPAYGHKPEVVVVTKTAPRVVVTKTGTKVLTATPPPLKPTPKPAAKCNWNGGMPENCLSYAVTVRV